MKHSTYNSWLAAGNDVIANKLNLALYRLNGVRHEPLQRTIRLQDARKLGRIVKRGGSVALSFEESRVLAATDRTSFVCRVLDGRFPDYRRVIPGTFPTQARDNVLGEFVPDAEALVQALKRVALTANDTNRKVSLRVDDDGLTLSATNDLGTSAERVAVKSFSGDPLETALNAQFQGFARVIARGGREGGRRGAVSLYRRRGADHGGGGGETKLPGAADAAA